MKKVGWLINDTLTCIPETKTFWHNLLEWFPDLIDKTNKYTPYNILPDTIEKYYNTEEKPYYVIRNASYFRKLNIHSKTISLLQDINANRIMQLDVCYNSDIVVVNSSYTHSKYKEINNDKIKIIPLGIDFDFFKPIQVENDIGILENSILFIGDNTNYPKGFDLLMKIVDNTNYNFCFVMKSNFNIKHPRIKIFNKITHDKLLKICNLCKMLICTSVEETQHLSGIEAGACNIPIVTTNVGIYHGFENNLSWGIKCNTYDEFIFGIKKIYNNINNFNTRDIFLSYGLDIKTCKLKWEEIINKL